MTKRIFLSLLLVLGACLEPATSTAELANTASPDADVPKPKAKPLELSDCGKAAMDVYPKCAAFTPTAMSCMGIWMANKQGKDAWQKDGPICLGLGKHIDQCTKCNRLNLAGTAFDVDGCANQKFLACGRAKLLPNQGTGTMCFIDDPGAINIYPPIDDRNYTGREMCYFSWDKKPPAFPTKAEVAACKTAAGCPVQYAAADLPPASRVGCTCQCLADSGEGCDETACNAEIAAEPTCALQTSTDTTAVSATAE